MDTAILMTAQRVGDAVPVTFTGTVLAFWRRTLLASVPAAPGGLVALTASALDGGPAGIMLPEERGAWRLHGLAEGTAVACEAGVLRSGDLEVETRGAPRPDTRVIGLGFDPARPRALAALAEAERVLATAEGAQSSARGDPSPDRLADVARRRVARVTSSLCEALAAADAATVGECVPALVGLGPGATPSGDDALLGVLLAAWLRRGDGDPRSGGRPGMERALAVRVRANADRTTALSRSFLLLACDGRFPAAMRSLALALHRADVAGTRAAARACLDTGHTSGADGLLGVVRGLRATAGTALLASEGA